MELPAISIGAWSYGLAAFAYALLAARYGSSARTGLRGAALVVALVVTSVWAACDLAFAMTQYLPIFALANVIDVFRATSWQAFLLLMLRQAAGAGEATNFGRLWPVSFVLGTTAIGANVLPALGVTLPGDGGRLALFAALALSIFGLVLTEQIWRNTPEDSRWGTKPLCLGLAAISAFDIYHFADALLFSRFDVDLWAARGFVYTLAAPLLAVSTVRARADVFRVRVSRRVVFHTATLVASGAYLLFMAAAGYYVRYFGGEWGRAVQVAFLFGALLLLGAVIVSGSARAKARVLVSKHFFRYRYDYREEWLRFTQALAATQTGSEMGVQIVRALANLVESPSGGLWTSDGDRSMFTQAARWNMPHCAAEEPARSALATFLATSGWVVNLEEYRSSPVRYRDLVLPAWIHDVPNAWLVVPLVVSSDLLGFVVLTTARARIDINWEVNDLLKTAARQAASFLAQMSATEALLEARKFDAFNRMSAFVVHDLKNIVSQLSLMLRNAERHRDNPEFQQDMLDTVAHSVDRMKQLMMQLREGNRPVDAAQGVSLAPIIARIAAAKSTQQPLPEITVTEAVAVRGHEDRLERVIGHLVQNALDATDRTDRVWIKLEREADHAIVEVGDTGHGMTPEFVRDRLFKPFQTTKQTGMGIGAYESFQYVRELGGRVMVDTAPGMGTRVRLSLPLLDGMATAANGPANSPPISEDKDGRAGT